MTHGTEIDARPAPLVIRRAGVADAPEIARIGVLGWQAAYRGILPDAYLDAMSVEARATAWGMLLEHETSDATPAWIAERGGLAIGFLHSGPPRDRDLPPDAAEMYALYVLPGQWRGGAGRALMATALSYWSSRGTTAFALWVLETNGRGRSFYEAMGWLSDGSHQQLEIGGFAATEVRYRLGLRS